MPTKIPLPRAAAPRLPGTYAASFERDMDWRRGVTALWVLFALAAIGEAMFAAMYLLRGYVGYPTLGTGVLLAAGSASFVGLWLGWGWLRWALSAVAFGRAGWLILWLISMRANTPGGAGTEAHGFGLDSIPPLWLGLTYLAMAGYLAFSADVLDFLRHRREEGRGWIVAPVGLLVGVCLLALFGAETFYVLWLGHEKNSALAYVTESLRVISGQGWDVKAYESRADPDYLKTWYDGDRKNVFAGLSHVGKFRRISGAPGGAVGSASDATGGGFMVNVDCHLGRTEFDHGAMDFEIDLGRTLFGPWQLRGFNANDVHVDGKPVPSAPP